MIGIVFHEREERTLPRLHKEEKNGPTPGPSTREGSNYKIREKFNFVIIIKELNFHLSYFIILTK